MEFDSFDKPTNIPDSTRRDETRRDDQVAPRLTSRREIAFSLELPRGYAENYLEFRLSAYEDRVFGLSLWLSEE